MEEIMHAFSIYYCEENKRDNAPMQSVVGKLIANLEIFEPCRKTILYRLPTKKTSVESEIYNVWTRFINSDAIVNLLNPIDNTIN